MRLIQPVLIIAFFIGMFLYFRFARTRTLDRLIMVLLVLSGVVMIMYPDLTTSIANLIGVGRGTDLLLYFGLTVSCFALIFLYSKMRSLESRLTQLVRAMAIQEALYRASAAPDTDTSGTTPDLNSQPPS